MIIENRPTPIAPLPDLLRAVAYSLRLKILRSLAESPMHVDALAQGLQRDASSISRHLGVLHGTGLVCVEKIKKRSVYRISPRVTILVHEQVLRLSTISEEGLGLSLSFPIGKAIWSDPAHEGETLHGRIKRIDA